MPFADEFLTQWKKHFSSLVPPHKKILLAVSGGMDSVVMTDLFSKAKIPAVVAHANFQLRGPESDRDEQFVEDLASFYHLEFLVKHFDTTTFSQQQKISIQEAARLLRYQWFRDLITMDQYQLALIATAHHANDSLETLLINFFRGTGIAGLHGILPVQENIIRPLIFWKQEKLKFYAIENNLSWVDDSSNESDKYTRNYFRHQLIPSLQKVFTGVEDNLLNNISRFSEIEDIYKESIQAKKKKLLKPNGEEWFINLAALLKCKNLATLFWEILKDFHFTASQANEAIKLLDSDYGAHISSATHRLIRHRNKLIIAPLKSAKQVHFFIDDDHEQVVTPKGILHIKMKDAKNFHIPTSALEAALDLSGIKFPLVLRPIQPGDYFYPLGMRKKKKIKRFLIDQKLSVIEKEKCLVLENAEKQILWLVGMRIDERFKITGKTSQILHIRLQRT
ncbi:MAG: tRNA lysidine(34) synthetase TilS [Bacteroidetes bacterium]|nr:tRNA lysidine(34) synthetase TilS [Bacteroidota bacterium]